MDTASIQFVLFGLGAALVSNFSRSKVWRAVVLGGASAVFLAILAQNFAVILPLLGFVLLGYSGLLLLRHGWPLVSILAIIVILAYVWLKKYSFLPEATFLHMPYFTLGLSYIFFRVLHLLIDTGQIREQRGIGFGEYLLYTFNFTTLVSGPIQRYDRFAEDQFADNPVALGPRVVGLQLERIVRGFFKVNVLATLFDMIRVDALTQIYQPLPVNTKLFAVFRVAFVYPLFLYCNFSGYIDIVIGIARLMRVRLPENFDRPFSATSFLDFWNRWHITLSTWLKTYVYNPLLMILMSREPPQSLQPYLGVLCFFVTFFLIGIWHGRTSEFAVYGVLLGGGAAINKMWQVLLRSRLGRNGYKGLTVNPFYLALARGLTFTWFAFSLLWFWADWKQIRDIGHALPVTKWLVLSTLFWVSVTIVFDGWERLRLVVLAVRTTEGPAVTSRYAKAVFTTCLAVVAIVFSTLMNQAAPPIVYKAF